MRPLLVLRRLAPHLALLALWELASRTIIPPLFLPAPSSVVRAAIATLRSGELQLHLYETLVVLGLGFGLAVVSGIAIGLLLGSVRPLARLVNPYVTIFYAMPTVALVPLVVDWLGLETVAKVFLTWLVSVFPIIISVETGVTEVPPALIETARAFCCTRWQILTKVVLYAAVPFLVNGVKLGLGRALVGVVVAEMFTALSGLGYMVSFYGSNFRTAYLFVPIATLAVLGLLITAVIRRLERHFAPWRVQ
jgi:ABC-type nitrate/sulfonate/bicarbonate transport system permease component